MPRACSNTNVGVTSNAIGNRSSSESHCLKRLAKSRSIPKKSSFSTAQRLQIRLPVSKKAHWWPLTSKRRALLTWGRLPIFDIKSLQVCIAYTPVVNANNRAHLRRRLSGHASEEMHEFILTMNSKRSVKPFQRFHDYPENHENYLGHGAGRRRRIQRGGRIGILRSVVRTNSVGVGNKL
jgi:hypothetical protein